MNVQKDSPVTNAFRSCPLSPVTHGFTICPFLLCQKNKPTMTDTRNITLATEVNAIKATRFDLFLFLEFVENGGLGLEPGCRGNMGGGKVAIGGEGDGGGD